MISLYHTLSSEFLPPPTLSLLHAIFSFPLPCNFSFSQDPNENAVERAFLLLLLD